MEEIMQVVVNNGLGVASFLALLYFMKYYITKINDTTEKIADTTEKVAETLQAVEKNLSDLTTRVDKIERKRKEKNENDN